MASSVAPVTAAAAAAAAAVAVAPTTLDGRILEACGDIGATGPMLVQRLGITLAELQSNANRLLKSGKLDIVMRSKEMHFVVASAQTKRLAKFSVDERLIYQIIEAAGNKGIWLRDIRAKSNLEQKRVNSIIKKLRANKLIKSVTSVVASKKKLYMLFDLEPDESLTGGAWYADEEFDAIFVKTLRDVVIKYLQTKCPEGRSFVSPMERFEASLVFLTEVHTWVTDSGIFTQALRKDDIEKVLDTLVLDGTVEQRKPISGQAESRYRLANVPQIPPGLYATPCGACPVQQKCVPGGIVSPESCTYLADWAQF